MAKSKIRDALVELTGLKEIRGEEDVAFRKRLISAVGELSDGDWESLSSEQQDWFNDAADNINSKKDPIDFPDLEEEEAATTRTRRGAAPAEEPEAKPARGGRSAKAAPAAPVVGDLIVVTTKRGKVSEGELLEIDGDIIVVDVAGEEVEFTKDRVESIVKKESEVASQAQDDAPEYEPAVDDEVIITNKRGKVSEGVIVEIDDSIIVIDDGKDEQEFQRDRLESVVLKEAPAENKSTRRGAAAKEEEPEAKPTSKRGAPAKEVPAPATDKKKISAKDNGGVSVSQRIMELVAEDIKATKDEIAKILTKEGLEFRDNTLAMNHASAHKFITILKAAGHTIK